MELTQEYFDEKLKNLATKDDLKGLATTREIEELAQMVSEGFADLQSRLDVSDRVQKIETTLERKFGKLEEALHIKL